MQSNAACLEGEVRFRAFWVADCVANKQGESIMKEQGEFVNEVRV